jgi:hypothetical protein
LRHWFTLWRMRSIVSLRDHTYKSLENFHDFWPLPPSVSKSGQFLTPPLLKCRRLKWMVPNVWTWLKLLCAQAENCQHYSEWGGYSSQEIGLTWLDLSGINEACLIDKEERGSLEGCKQKTFSTMDLYPIWRSILNIMYLLFQYYH